MDEVFFVPRCGTVTEERPWLSADDLRRYQIALKLDGYDEHEITRIITYAVENGFDEREHRNVNRILVELIVKLQRICSGGTAGTRIRILKTALIERRCSA